MARGSIPIPEQRETGEPRLDTLAYAAELERRLVDAESVREEQLAVLARERAAAVRDAILEAGASLESRVFVGDVRQVDDGEEAAVPMEVVLSADGVSPTAGPGEE